MNHDATGPYCIAPVENTNIIITTGPTHLYLTLLCYYRCTAFEMFTFTFSTHSHKKASCMSPAAKTNPAVKKVFNTSTPYLSVQAEIQLYLDLQMFCTTKSNYLLLFQTVQN